MYDRGKELNLKHYRDIGFMAAMGKVSGRPDKMKRRYHIQGFSENI